MRDGAKKTIGAEKDMTTRLIITALATMAAWAGAAPDDTASWIFVVGADTNGAPVQQVVWLHENPDLKEQACPLLAASFVAVMEEQEEAVKVMADRMALPADEKWSRFVLKGNVVIGWIEKKHLVRVPMASWRKYKDARKPGEQPGPGGEQETPSPPQDDEGNETNE